MYTFELRIRILQKSGKEQNNGKMVLLTDDDDQNSNFFWITETPDDYDSSSIYKVIIMTIKVEMMVVYCTKDFLSVS